MSTGGRADPPPSSTGFTAAPTGLTASQAAERLAADGPNTVVAVRPRRLVTRVLHQVTDPLVGLLIAALVVTVALGDHADAAVIALVVVVNTTIGVAQEVRADQAIAALDQLAAPVARVVRDGLDRVVPAAEVVAGDVVRLEAGDVVPADLVLDVAHRVRVDESALTGESVPVDREVGQDLLAGTVLVVGRAVGTVSRTGARSGLGRISALVSATRSGPTPLQRRLSALGRVLAIAVVVASAIVFGLGLLSGRSVFDMSITAVSLVVAAVPESLPAVVTLALALGARRMAAHRAIPRRLHAVETLGSVTVVASDKTGTLTEGRMAVQRAVAADGTWARILGTGYAPDGEVRPDDATVDVLGSTTGAPAVHSEPFPGTPAARSPSHPPTASLLTLARAGLLCSDATIAPPDPDHPQWRAVGDPMEAAIVAFAARCGVDPQAERASHPRVAEHPFDQGTRRMTTVHSEPSGDYLVICKGAPEAVLAAPLVADPDPATIAAAHQLAEGGLRVIAVASAIVAGGGPPDPTTARGLRVDGLIGIGDPIRDDAPAIAAAFDAAGIRLVLITGDHPGTASAIGDQLGIWRAGDELARGDELTTGDHGVIDPDHADRARVFARTQPEQKLDIITALQAHGHVVAMTGDGVNDAPALRRADIGVAMGGGTEVARQAADLVLLDDNLGTVTAAVAEGRRIFDNIRRFLLYGLSGGAAELMVMLIGPAVGLPVPLLPAQILWINLLTHGVPGVALGAEPAAPGIMTRPPRSPQESVLGGGLLSAVMKAGAVLSVVVLAAGVAAAQAGLEWQSIIFMVLGLAQLGIALAVRAPRGRGRPGNSGLVAALVVSAVLQVAGVVVPPLRELLGTHPLSPAELLGCLVVATIPGVVVRLGRARVT